LAFGSGSGSTARYRGEENMNYGIWSGEAITRLNEMSGLPTETIFSHLGVVLVESMSYVEAVMAMMV
jgi:hypothetical protein